MPSHLYSYSFAPNPDWTHTFSGGDEIRAYFERVAADHDVARDVRFGDEVVACTFTDGRWEIETASGRRDTVDVVIAATGVLHHPNLPDDRRASSRSRARRSTAPAGITRCRSTAPASG